MAGIERLNKDKTRADYECDCQKETTYGIYRDYPEGTTWYIDSCCGGGCVSASDIKFCPFCSLKIKVRQTLKWEKFNVDEFDVIQQVI